MRLFVISSSRLCRGDFFERTEEIASSTPDRFILREKQLSHAELLPLAEKCSEICRKHSVPFSINSDIEAAHAVNAELHLPYPLLLENADRLKTFPLFGVSVHSVSEARNAERLGASYLIAGHIFATDCKKGLKPRGLEYLSEISSAVKIPVLGIGGITRERIPSVLSSGAAGICVMSHFMSCENVSGEISAFKELLRVK